MKYTLRSLIAALLCLCICLSLAVPAFAANSKGITFTAILNQDTFTVCETAQTVTMDIVASSPVSVDGIGGDIRWDAPLELTSISNSEANITFEASRMNLSTGRFGWSSSDGENVTGVTNIAQVTFTIPANTPAGTYNVGIQALELTEAYAEIWENGATATAALTIAAADAPAPELPEGYSVTLGTLTPSPTHEDRFDVNIAVNHEAAEGEAIQTHFAAGQFNITYNNTALSFNQNASALGSARINNVDNGNGTSTLKVADFGEDKPLGTNVYTLNFTAAKPGETALTLSSTAFSGKENAAVSDLIAAAIPEPDLDVNVQKKVFTVTLPEGFASNGTSVTDGDSFSFWISNPHYHYGKVYFAMGGSEAVVLAPNADGSYTIPSVTGNVTVTTEKMEPRSYGVTFIGEVASGANTAAYMTDYQFTLPTDKAGDHTKGYTYSVESITIGGTAYSGHTTTDGRTYTIKGEDIKGSIVITIKKTDLNPAYVKVTYTGHPGSVLNPVETIPYGSDYTMTLDKISGYHYAVSATMGNVETDVLINGNGSYTIKKVTGDLIIHIDRTVNTDGVSVEHYLTLDGANMYLVQKDPAESGLDEKYIPTYENHPMYWSSRYNTYCYLIISAEGIDLEAEKQKIDLAALSDTVQKVNIAYDMDVNMTNTVDAADAQLVYNMYSHPTITEFTEELSMMKFLKADVVGAGKSHTVDVNDAVAIINHVIGITASQSPVA